MENKIEYLKLFKTEKEYNTFVGNDTSVNPYVALCEDTEDVYFNTKKDTAGIEYVDLGLPSGTLWATKNVGANTDFDYGMLFTWGGTTGAKVSKDDSGNFVFGTDVCFGLDGNMLGKELYNKSKDGWQRYTESDNYTKLLPKDDAVHVNMGGDWHLPSKAQVQELIDKCRVEKKEINYKHFVYRYTSNINEQYIDFPIVGYAKKDSVVVSEDSQLYFMWTNELSEVYDTDAYTFGKNEVSALRREYGCLCRGVIGQKIEE